ncbi:hypothetical protein GCM10020358_04180 [Amorphoplanes nipponensis]|uniref:Uncharacterized protein n=1 Tax=Actinoplanes nipponensis TaxID=135950 RepID=A0A919JP06_9ACTN|nr:hypothetical protein [Actinoplanes nipponensis]GIE52696.1 hypothetical protein Ani05nite_62300 [Actinoplanes nipponensis]
MTTEQPELRPLNPLNLTVVSLERFFYAMRTIAENDLWDDAHRHLKSRGCDTIAISVEPILALQGMLRKRRTSSGVSPAATAGATAGITAGAPPERTPQEERVDRFIASACAPPPHYPPRPPDDWPKGPWDPPMLEE